MSKKIINLIIFILSLMSLFISLKLFWNIGILVDEFNSTPALICGGDFWLGMDWLRLGLLFIICILSGINAFSTSKR